MKISGRKEKNLVMLLKPEFYTDADCCKIAMIACIELRLCANIQKMASK
jgi:hypothetical protein